MSSCSVQYIHTFSTKGRTGKLLSTVYSPRFQTFCTEQELNCIFNIEGENEVPTIILTEWWKNHCKHSALFLNSYV